MLPSKQPATKFYGGKNANVLSFELQLVIARYKGQEVMKVYQWNCVGTLGKGVFRVHIESAIL